MNKFDIAAGNDLKIDDLSDSPKKHSFKVAAFVPDNGYHCIVDVISGDTATMPLEQARRWVDKCSELDSWSGFNHSPGRPYRVIE